MMFIGVANCVNDAQHHEAFRADGTTAVMRNCELRLDEFKAELALFEDKYGELWNVHEELMESF